jgi:transposase InsO family protein
LNPARSGAPLPADLAVMTPRCEVAPVILAVYLLSDVPFVLLLPVDLLDQTRRPGIFSDARVDEIARRLEIAGKIVLLEAQMVWVIGNLPGCRPVEIFTNHLRTPAPITGFRATTPRKPGAVEDDLEHVEGAVPRTLEAWIHAQQMDEDFPDMLESVEHKAMQNDLWIIAPPDTTPSIIVPLTCRELLVRDTHERMFHLAHTKVYALLKRSYFWPTQKRDVRNWLENCPACEINKARQNTAHGLFSALPVHAPRARWCMDFQGQGKALTGETEALALIDPTSRYVVVIPLKDREATTWLQPFLDRIVFTFGAPDVLHSDAAPEFLSEALDLLAQAAEIQTTTTLGHNARGNGTIEVFWRFWNRCMRMLPDDHYCRWPAFAQRIAFAYNTACHDSIAFVTPFEVQHGAPARNALLTPLLNSPEIDEEKQLFLPGEFAAAVAVSTRAFSQLAKTHDEFVRNETAARLNKNGRARTFKIGDKVKVRVPPTAAQMEETGRRAKHITAWRGPCTIIERLSNTAYSAIDDISRRRYERVISNLLPYRAGKAKDNANAAYNQQYSEPFTIGEFIAIRDDPTGPFYVAKVELIFDKTITVHYYGCTGMVLNTAIFKPCWHMVCGDDIVLQCEMPDWNDDGRPNFVAYSGTLDLRDVHTVLVARQLEFTKAGKLRFKSIRALAPFQDQLFRFER